MTWNSEPDAGAPAEAAASPGGFAPGSILERIAGGDRAAVGECIDVHGGLVRALAFRFCNNLADTDDLVQDVFIEIWKCAGRYDSRIASETTFVAMVARRRMIDRRRKLRTEPVPRSLPEGLTAAPSRELLEQADDVARAEKALESLREEQRRVLSLSLRDGLTYDQIARTVGLPLGTVKTHARRGLIRLRELLGGASEPSETVAASPGAGEAGT